MQHMFSDASKSISTVAAGVARRADGLLRCSDKRAGKMAASTPVASSEMDISWLESENSKCKNGKKHENNPF